MKRTNSIKMTSVAKSRNVRGHTDVRISDPTPLTITDDVLFRWARIVKISKMFSVMHTIRALEHKILASSCRSCQKRNVEHDRSALEEARRLLAECSDAKARLVKESAGITQYRVRYHDLSGTVHEIIR